MAVAAAGVLCWRSTDLLFKRTEEAHARDAVAAGVSALNSTPRQSSEQQGRWDRSGRVQFD